MRDTLHNWQREYELSSDWTRRTRRTDFKILDRIITFLGPETNPRHVYQIQVRKYRDLRAREGMKASTIRRELHIGRKFYKYLIMREIVEPFFNPFEGIQFHPPPENKDTETTKAS